MITTDFTRTAFTPAPFTLTALFTESDLVSVTARAVAVPLREIYGLLWRAGVLEIVA